MKSGKMYVALAFMMAIGSAFASEYLVAQSAWTRISEVPAQLTNCVQRTSCEGMSQECKINIDHDGISSTSPIDVQLYSSSCATPLFRD